MRNRRRDLSILVVEVLVRASSFRGDERREGERTHGYESQHMSLPTGINGPLYPQISLDYE